MQTEPLWTPQTIIALVVLSIAALTIAAVFVRADTNTMNVIASLVIGTIIGSVSQFYFGSSKGSQAKDELIARQIPPPTP